MDLTNCLKFLSGLIGWIFRAFSGFVCQNRAGNSLFFKKQATGLTFLA